MKWDVKCLILKFLSIRIDAEDGKVFIFGVVEIEASAA